MKSFVALLITATGLCSDMVGGGGVLIYMDFWLPATLIV